MKRVLKRLPSLTERCTGYSMNRFFDEVRKLWARDKRIVAWANRMQEKDGRKILR